MGKFKVGQYVGVISQKKFIEELKDGKYKVAKIISSEPTTIGCDDNTLYTAQDENDKSRYVAFSKCVSCGMYEFVDIDTLAYYLEMYGKDKITDGYGMIDDAKKLRNNKRFKQE